MTGDEINKRRGGQTKARKLYQLTPSAPLLANNVSQSIPLLPVCLWFSCRQRAMGMGRLWGGPREAAWNWDTAGRGPKASEPAWRMHFFCPSTTASAPCTSTATL